MTEERTDAAGRVSSLTRDAGITAAVAGLFFLLRILAVSRWDWETAGAVAETVEFGDAATILLGTVFARPIFTGELIILLTPIIIVTLIWSPTDDRRAPLLTGLVLFGLLAIMASLIVSEGEWWILIGVVVGTALLAFVRTRWRDGRPGRLTTLLLRSLGWIGVLAFLAMAVGIPTPWVALERIQTEDAVIEGYVLQTPSGFLKVLTEEPREVVILISSRVESREILSDR